MSETTHQLPIDYASQNEEWILVCNQLEERVAAALHESNGNTALLSTEEAHEDDDDENQTEEIVHLESMMLAARMGRLANIQCAMMDEKTSNNNDKQYLEQYLIQTQQEFDASPGQPLVELLSQVGGNSSSASALLRETSSPSLPPSSSRHEDLLCADLDVDAFFEEYPECIRSDYGIHTSDADDSSTSSSSDSSVASSSQCKISAKNQRRQYKESTTTKKQADETSVSVETSQVAAKRQASSSLSTNVINPPVIDLVNDADLKAAPSHENTSLHPSSVDNPYLQVQRRPSTFRNPPPMTKPAPLPPGPTQQEQETVPPTTVNPYATKNRSGPPHSQQPPSTRDVDPHAASSMQNQTAWANHCHQQNHFQTAREMADAGHSAHPNSQEPTPRNGHRNGLPIEQNHAQPRSSVRQWGQPPPPPTSNNPYGFDYSNEETHEQVTTNVPSGPHIPESLKRKFQPPKKIANNNGNGNSASQAFGPSKGGGVRASRPQTNRPSSANGTQKNNSSGGGAVTHRNGDGIDDAEEELPEELQHLDKELVLKIQNEIMESGETVTFDDIAGLKDAKQTVLEVVVWPMQRPDVFTGLRRAPNGLLLFGPPGTGKTLIGKAIANETKATFFSISSSSLTSKWIGEGEKLVKTLFAVAAYREPAVVFIDEIDSLLTQRKSTENEASRRIKTEFLVQLDGAGTSKQGRVLTIGATNRPQELDEAARRRFTKRMYIPLPVESDRRVLLHVMLRNNNHQLTDAQIETLAKDTAGFSGADLKALCTDAAMGPIRQLGAKAMEVEVKDIPPISYKHFKRSLKGTRPSVAPEDITQYIDWDRVYGSSRAEEAYDDDDDEEEED
jgi:fidgetin-like protein 1